MNYYAKHSRTCPVSGDRIRPHRVEIPNAHAHMIERMGRPRDWSAWDWLPCALADAVNAGTLFPDLGDERTDLVDVDLMHAAFPHTSPTPPEPRASNLPGVSWLGVVPRHPVFPERVFRAFRRLARAHGLTPSQAVANLAAWHYRHTGDAPARVSPVPVLK